MRVVAKGMRQRGQSEAYGVITLKGAYTSVDAGYIVSVFGHTFGTWVRLWVLALTDSLDSFIKQPPIYALQANRLGYQYQHPPQK